MKNKNITLEGKKVFITGAAGFIGANLVLELLQTVSDITIVGIDNLNDYYDVSIKKYRLKQIEEKLKKCPKSTWKFVKGSIADKLLIEKLFKENSPSIVINLAAQAGVRYSITNPDVYIESNLIGFYNILEACRHSYDDGENGVEHLVYASSSSVYGSNKKIPYSTDDKVDNPVSLYAATKKSNELMAHAYSKLYNIPSTGLRFFTVYGPAGRPDMAYFGFTNKLCAGDTIKIFNYGNCKRDFTYIDDIVEGIKRVMQVAPQKKSGRTDYRFLHIKYIILETVIRKTCLNLWIYFNKNLSRQNFFQKIMILNHIKNWWQCNREMYRLHMQIPLH